MPRSLPPLCAPQRGSVRPWAEQWRCRHLVLAPSRSPPPPPRHPRTLTKPLPPPLRSPPRTAPPFARSPLRPRSPAPSRSLAPPPPCPPVHHESETSPRGVASGDPPAGAGGVVGKARDLSFIQSRGAQDGVEDVSQRRESDR